MADIDSVSFQDAAVPAEIAGHRSFCAQPACAGHYRVVQLAAAQDFAQPGGGPSAKLALRFVLGSACLGSVKADQPMIRLLPIDADRIPVNDSDSGCIDRLRMRRSERGKTS
ncbi:hypothetical protein ACJMQP_23785 [Rhodopseudomonas palustris]